MEEYSLKTELSPIEIKSGSVIIVVSMTTPFPILAPISLYHHRMKGVCLRTDSLPLFRSIASLTSHQRRK